jgi:hypothetical protein
MNLSKLLSWIPDSARSASVVQRVKENNENKAVAIFRGRNGVIAVEDFNNFNWKKR